MSAIRDLGFLAWRDPDAWMEKMSGPAWEALVDDENKRLRSLLQGIDPLITRFKGELTKAASYYNWEIFGRSPIRITPISAFSIQWRFEGDTQTITARDIDTNGEYVAYTHDIGKGSETFELVVQEIATRKILWRKSPVGPTIFVQGFIGNDGISESLCYLGVEQKLWYNTLYRCNLSTGNDIETLYKESDPHYNLSLTRNWHVGILTRENAGKTDTFYIDTELIPIAPGSERQVVCLLDTYYYREPGTDTYKASPNITDSAFEGTPIVGNELQYVITRKQGESRVYTLEFFEDGDVEAVSHTERVHIKQGTILSSPFTDRGFLIDDGTAPPYYLNKRLCKIQSPYKGAFKLKAHKIKATSADGTDVYGTLLHNTKIGKPKALFAVGYGAYGVASSPAGAYGKWTPLLNREWAVLYTYIRGGGDDSDAWADRGRLEGRTHTRDDFLALVEAAQKQFKIPPAKTVLYGRSAGGFLMGMCLNKEPTGRLFGTVYTEVPYVDILRTTTNPKLPLTKMEYNEFGDPAHRPEDFGFLVDISPADIAVTTAAPNIFVLARTGLHDSQVYAYEPVKWIRRLRKPGDTEEKVIGIAREEGHFYSGEAALQAKAEDLALLHSRIFPSTAI